MPRFVPVRFGPVRFVPPRLAGDAPVVGIGEDLSVASLVNAYRQGIFPWPVPGYPLLWFCPPQRAVLDFECLHIPNRLARLRRRTPLTFTMDRAFDQVIAACQTAPRPNQDGTWITPPMHDAYRALHRAGHAHSVEAWDEAGALVGGLYGVSAGVGFSGESMFHAAPNASKLALLFLTDHLANCGLNWMDIQVMTPHLAALGAHEMPRDEFLDRLDAERERELTLFD